MRFMLIVKGNKDSEAGVLPTEKELAEMGKFNEEMVKAGVMLAGDGLQASSKGARVQFTKGKPTVVDGPFAEAKELVAGYCIVQTATKAEAVEFGRRMLQIHIDGTGIDAGEVEIRQVHELEDFPVSKDEQPDGWRAKEQAFRDHVVS